MSVYGMAVKLGIKGAAEAGKRGLVNNGVTKEFAEESSVAFEAASSAEFVGSSLKNSPRA